MKRLKPGELVLIDGENLSLPTFGRKPIRCEVVSVRRKTFTIVRTGERKSGIEVRIRDPKGEIWITPHWSLTRVYPLKGANHGRK